MSALRIAAFITPHGFGHAARCCAILEALAAQRAVEECVIFTAVPRWFLNDSLTLHFSYHSEECDVGLVQKSPVEEDLAATVVALGRLLDDFPGRSRELGRQLLESNCQAVICDISPLGLAAAHWAGLPGILVESFTWDWIYQGYAAAEPRLERLADRLRHLTPVPHLHLQTTPVCKPASAALCVPPVSRRPRHSRQQVRRLLNAGTDEALVLWTMGGIPWHFPSLEDVALPPGVRLIVPDGDADETLPVGRFYHPDLMAACDAVVGKLGYSTVAEAWSAGTPFGYVSRPCFPETPVLEEFAFRHMAARPLPPDALEDGSLGMHLAALLALPRNTLPESHGAALAARSILELLDE